MTLRSANWFGGPGLYPMMHRAWIRAEGLPPDELDGRPVIGICNSWSELTSCNAHLRLVADAVKRGVWEAGGLPLEFPTISLGEVFMKPTAMLYRNLMAMDVEECIRANPIDGVVLLCGCDKTTPAQLMGAASANLPAIMVPGGPMLTGRWRGEKLGSGTDAVRLGDLHRQGKISDADWAEVEGGLSRSAGHCTVMGTASTMTSVAEALGMTLTGCASIPAPDSRRIRFAHESGRRAVELVREGLRPREILNRAAIENAIRVSMALGGSTNAVIHLVAIAQRCGIELPLERFGELSRETPLLANVKPSGDYFMEDFFHAGGVPALMHALGDLLDLDVVTVSGRKLGQQLQGHAAVDERVIAGLDRPLAPEGGTTVLKGNLAPRGAIIKRSAASPHLLRHRGPALVFSSREELLARIDDPDLEVDADSVLVLQNAGPIGGPGMPEWGQLPLPRKLLEAGVTDMVRISDARMSGTSYGTVVLHVAPESAAGGPLAIVRSGDPIALDVGAGTLTLDLPDAEIATRLAGWEPPSSPYARGYGALFCDHVLQADQGCDFDFLLGADDTDDDLPARYAVMGHS